jgi:hypothetical protein
MRKKHGPRDSASHNKFEGLEKVVIPPRICIGERAGNECNVKFQPDSRCNTYITNLGD